MATITEELKVFACPFEELCEEVYSESEMKEFRKQCTLETCKKCDHYWGFFQGYCEAIE